MMNHLFTIVILISVNLQIIFANELIDIDVYYESLCPDSKQFITKQLYPTIIKDFSNNVNLTLYPYGKSSYRFTDVYVFQCHHGPEECRGNKIHACALRLIDGGNQTEAFGYNKKSFGTVNCLMARVKKENDVADFHLEECAKENMVDIADKIEKCSKTQQGDVYLSEYGHFTESLKPSLQSVPLIIFNKKNIEEVSKRAFDNFKEVLCEQFTAEKPSTCSGSVFMPRLVILFTVLVPFLY